MSIRFSSVVAAQPRQMAGFVSLLNLDLDKLGGLASPVLVLDDFRARDLPFSPHPHAGFSAVTYILADSQGGLRSRTSLGNDIVVAPGGIVGAHAGSRVIHEEIPADRERELHGLQIFVNLSSKYKLTAPRVLQLEPNEVPEWRSDAGDRVRVVVGTFEGLSSSLVPVEPFTLLDVELQHELSFELEDGHKALVYVLEGSLVVRGSGREQQVIGGHALALHGSGETVLFEGIGQAHFFVLSGAEIREPVVARGPFIMNEQSQIDTAVARYNAGGMGRLEHSARADLPRR